MIKKFTLLFICLLSIQQSFGQIGPNAFAEDFTMTDLDGTVWNLYDVLDEGKSVILDFSATWCGPCWDYHQTKQLEDLYNRYGPNGTNEFMVFFIEGDDSTNEDCLRNLPGCNNITLGDWVAGTSYPILDDVSANEDYNITYFPTLYHVCPNRIVNEIGQETADVIYQLHSQCSAPFGDKNLSIISYNGLMGPFCASQTFSPGVLLQNLGNTEVNSARIELKVNGNVTQVIDWTGSRVTYTTQEIVFDEITVNADTEIEINVTSVDGIADEDLSDNTIIANLFLSEETSENFLTLELQTDGFAYETYWSILDESGNAVFTGGNQEAIGGSAIGLLDDNTLYNWELPLPSDGCYEFRIYDVFGDGLCCSEGDGYYKLSDSSDQVLAQGATFTFTEFTPFSISGGTTIINSATLIAFNDLSRSFCQNYTYDPQVTIQNTGVNEITEMTFRVTDNGATVYEFPWIGSIDVSGFGFIDLSEVFVTEDSEVIVEILTVNGETSPNTYSQTAKLDFSRTFTESKSINLEIQLPEFAYEVYWEFTDTDGQILASGGNELAADVVDGMQIGTAPTDPGAYTDGTLVNETIDLSTGSVSGCYLLSLKDAFGDGISTLGGTSYVKVTGEDGAVIYNENLEPVSFFVREYPMEIETGLSGLSELTKVNDMIVFPNPTTGMMNLDFNLEKTMDLNLTVIDAVGKVVVDLGQREYIAGQQRITQDLTHLNSGVYLIQISNDDAVVNKKFTIIK